MRASLLGALALSAAEATAVTGFATPAYIHTCSKLSRWSPATPRWDVTRHSEGTNVIFKEPRRRRRNTAPASAPGKTPVHNDAPRRALCSSRRNNVLLLCAAQDSSAEDVWLPPTNVMTGEDEVRVQQRGSGSNSSSSGHPSTLVPPGRVEGVGIEASSLLPLTLLNAVTLLWGTQHAVIKLILQEDLSPGVTNFARFGIAALIFSPWTPGVLRDTPSIPDLVTGQVGVGDKEGGGLGAAGGGGGAGGATTAAAETWRAGAELGMWMFLGFAFQSIGLGLTTASRSAFLLYLNVKLVPFFAFVLEGRRISTPTWISAFLAFVGTVLLSSDGTPPNLGDFWSVLAAATSAMFILRLEKYSGSCDPSQLNSANLWITAGLCGAWAAWEVTTRGVDVSVALEGVQAQAPLIGYLAVVTTALTNWMQAVGQRSVPAERAAIIYAMDPVYAAGFAYLLLGETLGPAGLVGAGIITGAALWSQGKQMEEVDGDDDRVGDKDV
ncbi:unnamed protein product [Ectocarpus sp. 13 AM-2016]